MGYLIAMAVLPLTTAITLSTRIGLPSAITRAALHDYLATPAHWPKIVLSSVAVRGEAVDAPLGVGGSVDEIFGLPPVLPLEVRWTCTASDRDRGLLIFESRSGLSGIAENCKMDFRINTSQDSTDLELKMSFDPVSPIALLATPVLMLDNALALKFFLPRAVRPSTLGTMDPIAGPLVAAARRLGLLPEAEGDGWRGEPSAWAEADSLTQRLSAFSQRRLGSLKQWLAERAAGEYDVAAVDARLEAAIAGSSVMLFSFTSCPFCKKAKALLTAKGAAFSVLELDEDADGAALRAQLGRRTGRTSVPSVWIGGEYVGGMNDGVPGLGPLDTAGLLAPRLKEAGAIA